ncbi:MauE/DoxX family redox-associated membrane protein [Flavobacterium sp. DG2-3]|uniref:MauE/DoxX family redox-associated membrane protein n=1 Tax=Flavobacterium sp. DG2-3 TaxID=3068317 RepID=UPI00273DD271|nr:MauE/DoxX family redox-associated membrane protein [Flavobacterium sp. DG2-3]MDP5200212.1 hypothetical protein [Flavobacterium sp. DG2-3]
MKLNDSYIEKTVEIISLILVLLFVYAAVSKLIDFENFKIQLGQSPILTPYAEWMVFFIPLSEFGICLLLMFRSFKYLGLLLSFTMMFLFSLYIYIMLNYSSYVPCSCGGILEKMTWQQHLAFNLIFTVLAGIAFILLQSRCTESRILFYKQRFKLFLLSVCVLLPGLMLVFLFNLSNHIIHYKNKFVRRFPQHTAQELFQIDLKSNSCYFAGSSSGTIYLADSKYLLKVKALDTMSKKLTEHIITLEKIKMPFSIPSVKIYQDHFFVFEGRAPYFFSGRNSNWNADFKMHSGNYFSSVAPMDSIHLAVRYFMPPANENVIGKINLKDTTKILLKTDLLEKQIDGIIDTDGVLLYNSEIEKIIYVYAYRNEYLIINPKLKLEMKGKTIDTVSKVHLDLAEDKKKGRITLAKRPLMVNRLSATYGNLLFINSVLPGQYESDHLWRTASIIDVYDLSNRTYRSSFPVYDIDRKKIKGIYVYGSHLYAIIGSKLICYQLRKHMLQDHAAKAE